MGLYAVETQWIPTGGRALPLICTQLPENDRAIGYEWHVGDEALLARLLAHLLLARSDHAERILRGHRPTTTRSRKSTVQRIIDRVLNPTPGSENVYLRDGLLFQYISWVAAFKHYSAEAVLRAPHSRPADKGIDNLILTCRPGKNGPDPTQPLCITICEDKATANPRATVRDEVWPSLKTFEAGLRDPEVVHDVLPLLSQIAEDARDSVIDELFAHPKRYRVSLALDTAPTPTLFEGFDVIIPNPSVQRRRGEYLRTPALLRPWMNTLSTKVTEELTSLV